MLDAGLSLSLLPPLLQIQADAGVRAMHATARPSIQITPPPYSCFWVNNKNYTGKIRF